MDDATKRGLLNARAMFCMESLFRYFQYTRNIINKHKNNIQQTAYTNCLPIRFFNK